MNNEVALGARLLRGTQLKPEPFGDLALGGVGIDDLQSRQREVADQCRHRRANKPQSDDGEPVTVPGGRPPTTR